MRKLSEIYKELGIGFKYPISIKDANDKETYYEGSGGLWCKWQYNAQGNESYYESPYYWVKREYNSEGKEIYFYDSDGFWCKKEYDAKGNQTYYETNKEKDI